MSKKAGSSLLDAVNQAASAGVRPSPEKMREYQESNRARNEAFQSRVRASQPHGGRPSPQNITREDWFAGMALQALVQAAGQFRYSDGGITVEAVNQESLTDEIVSKLADAAKRIALEMTKE